MVDRLFCGKTVALLLVLVSGTAAARAQSAPLVDGSGSLDVSAGYSFFHANAPPGACGCFSANGATVSLQYKPARFSTQSFGFAADFTIVHAGNVVGSTEDLTLLTYTFGPSYHYRDPRLGRIQPFVQTLVGAAHTSSNYRNADGANGLALIVGGGADIRLGRGLALRAGEVDYVYSRLQNGSNDQQNNLRVGASLVLRVR